MNLQAYQIDILQKYIEGDIGKVQCKSVSVSQVEILRNKLRVLRELNVTLLSRKHNEAECYQTCTLSPELPQIYGVWNKDQAF